jgi:hypothetical protein
VADDPPTRSKGQTGQVIDYHFEIKINVVSYFDEKRLRKLIEDELKQLRAAVDGRKP